VQAQTFLDTFDEGFDPTLGWQGDTAAFRQNGGRLQLSDQREDSPGVARVWASAPTRDSACWTLQVELSFDPSASNFARWWLAADRALNNDEVRGYYLDVGGISGSADAYRLFDATGTSRELIAASEPGTAASSPNASLEVCFGESSQDPAEVRWALTVTPDTGSSSEATGVTSGAAVMGSFTGLELQYTATRNDAFFFDNYEVAPLFVDDTAPQLVAANALDARTIRIEASEPLAASSSDIANFSLAGTSASVISSSLDGAALQLMLDSDLPNGLPVELSIATLTDLAGNSSGPFEREVRYTAPRQLERYELLITEIMADPTPVIGLPEVEYVEFYNAGQQGLLLSDAVLQSSRGEFDLPEIMLGPGEYVALTGEEVTDDRYMQVLSFPTLTNSGGLLRLLNQSGETIDEVNYSPNWHLPSRDDGGYSLERIDLNQPCKIGASNWTSSEALSGGTPGVANAVATSLVADSLRIVRVGILDEQLLEVSLNRVLDSPPNTSFVSEGVGFADAEASDVLGTYFVTLNSALEPGVSAKLRLATNATSCVIAELVSAAPTILGIPDNSAPGDWELNEIMYDPLSGQGRWLELANVSNKLLSLDQLRLARLDEDGQPDDFVVPDREVLVPPGGLFVLSADPERLTEEFERVMQSALVEADVPTLGDAECLRLLDPVAEQVYWTVCYTEDWHNQAYANTDGVSLERISLSLGPNDASNWTSAASSVRFATPTRVNSQVLPEGLDSGVMFMLASERISPDGDGFEDLLALDYAFEEPGTLVNFGIYDVAGRPIFTSNEDISAGASGRWTWDGVNDDGDVAAIGTYVLRAAYYGDDRPQRVEHIAFSLLLAR